MTLIDVLDQLARYGQLIGGVSLGSAAGAAWYTAIRITQRNAKKDWAQREEAARLRADTAKRDAALRATETFRVLFAELWQNNDVTFIRRAITNDEEYKEIAHILAKRNLTKRNILTRRENDVIEKIDRFCSTLIRIKSFATETEMDDQHHKLRRKLLGEVWIDRIRADRPELHAYLMNWWPELEVPPVNDPAKFPDNSNEIIPKAA